MERVLKTFDRLMVDPGKMQGKPCIRGMRIPVALVLDLLANGMTEHEIIQEYPDLEPEDIRQCLRFAAYLSEDRIIARSH